MPPSDPPRLAAGGLSSDAPCLDSYTITCSALHLDADVSPAKIHPRAVEHRAAGAGPAGRSGGNSLGAARPVLIEASTGKELSARVMEHYEGYWKQPLTVIDAVRTPQYSRVWQVTVRCV